jgi:glycosyltransferase involved in cell wall biosynthesis
VTGSELGGTPAQTPVATIIVPVRNGSADVLELLELLDRQTVPRDRFQVVVGDDGSTDGLADAVGARAGVRVSTGPRANAYVARNRAAALRTGPVLVFCDADCRPEPDWLERGLAALVEADLAGGQVNWRHEGRQSLWTLLGVDQFIDQETAVATGSALGGNLFVRREIFDRVNGFDESVSSSGDYEFVARCLAAGGRLVYARNAVVWHPTYERAAFLRKYLRVNAKFALREGRAGRLPDGVKIRSWIPVVQTFRGRRRVGRPVLLNRRRLAESELAASPLEQAEAAVFIYLVLPYLRSGAQLWGWLAGRRDRRRGWAQPESSPAANIGSGN